MNPYIKGLAVTSIVTALSFSFPAAIEGADSAQMGSWRELGPLNIGRFGCKAFNIDGQRAIVFAGFGDESGPADTSAEILSITSGEWTVTAPMPAGFMPGAIPWAAKLNDGYFLVAGGANALGSSNLASYVYSVSTDSWIKTGNLPAGSSLASNFSQINAIVLDDGRVLVAGGLAGPAGIGETDASMLFTPNYYGLAHGATGEPAGVWAFTRDRSGRVTKLNGASEHHKLVKLRDGRVLIIHGYDHKYVIGMTEIYRDTYGVQAELFEPKSGTWTKLPNMPAIPGEDDRHVGTKGIRQMAAASLLPDGRVLLSGGFSSPADAKGRPLLKSVQYARSSSIFFHPDRFDLGTYPWSITGPMNVARHSHSFGDLPGPRGIISVGGYTNGGWTASTEMYDPMLGIWLTGPSLPAVDGTDLAVSRPWGCAALMPGGGVILAGGRRDFETGLTSKRTYHYQP